MNWQNMKRLAKNDYLKLLPILGLAFYMAFIPHQNYPYPLHIDEWVHLAFSEALMRAGSTTFTPPFSGVTSLALSSNLEAGFHLFWGVSQSISGISWLTIYRFFPSIIFMLTVLSVFIFARREGYGWEAAFFTCLIPTSIGILGPAFMVPVAMGLLFIPLSLFLVFNFRTGWSYLVLFIFTCFLLSIHAPTAIGLVIILIPYLVLNLKGNFKHSLGIGLALAVPFLAPFPWIFKMLLPTARLLLKPQPVPTYVDLPPIILAYGYIPVSLCLIGIFLLAIRGGRKNYGLIFGLLALLLMLVSFYTLNYGLDIVYTRGLMYMMLMLSLIAGAGLMGIRTIHLPSEPTGESKTRLTTAIGSVLCLVIIGLTLAIGIPERLDTQYYQMIDKEDYEAFVWIKDNVSEDYQKAILDPWKATAFTAITERSIYSRIHNYPQPADRKASGFLNSGCTDTNFLRENGISIVYNVGVCNNPDLIEVRKNVYLLKEP